MSATTPERPGEQLDAAAVLAWFRARYGDDVWRAALAEVTNDVLRQRITQLETAATTPPPMTPTPESAMVDPSRRESS